MKKQLSHLVNSYALWQRLQPNRNAGGARLHYLDLPVLGLSRSFGLL
jgi:hypothetical protein